jgi:hypothetical protein
MALPRGSLADDWGDLGFTYEEPPTLAEISPEAQQELEDAFAANPYPSPGDIDVIAYNTNLNVETVRTWYSLSEHSDTANATAPLHPFGPISVQSDTQFNSSWVDSRAESVADSGFFSNPSNGSSAHQRLDTSSYSTLSFPYGIDTASSLDVFPEQTQPDALLNIAEGDPWYPGSRVRIPE